MAWRQNGFSRRDFLAGTSALGLAAIGPAAEAFAGQQAKNTPAKRPEKALIAITLDLEMSRHFPRWDTMHWDYEKGNLDAATKRYTVEACRRVKDQGGLVQLFKVETARLPGNG